MANQAPEENEKQITAETAKIAAMTVISPKAAILAPLADLQAGEGQCGELKREISLLGKFLRLAGGTAGFLMGGPAGAALGSTVGELTGEIAAKQTSMIWSIFGSAFPHQKRAGMKKIVLIAMAVTADIPCGVDI
jgi:hypothetical protein